MNFQEVNEFLKLFYDLVQHLVHSGGGMRGKVVGGDHYGGGGGNNKVVNRKGVRCGEKKEEKGRRTKGGEELRLLPPWSVEQRQILVNQR